MASLRYDRGSIVIEGVDRLPFGVRDSKVNAFRAESARYQDVLDYLTRKGIDYVDEVLVEVTIPAMKNRISLRSYQQEALDAWLASKRGVVELPTGAGKTHIALKAIQLLSTATLVVVPTIDLMGQWKRWIEDELGVEVGEIGGGEYSVRPITVGTYDSSSIHAEHLGNRFMFLVFDEVHHLPAPSYRQIAELYVAPYRMGLTATLERDNGAHDMLSQLIGSLVYQLTPDDLAGKHLSPYLHERILVDLLPEERRTYNSQWAIFKRYLKKRRVKMRSAADFQRFIMRSGTDPEARAALVARNKAIDVALNSEAKLEILTDLLETYPEEKTILFTRHNDLVYKISSRILVPAITHQTQKEERNRILECFRSGQYKVIITSQVLDEGIDVPDASMAIIISGSGSSREYIQRLGRILRKREGKLARIFELVARDTLESRMSSRRHR
jgi:superfamily II DNA or RNA helicase